MHIQARVVLCFKCPSCQPSLFSLLKLGKTTFPIWGTNRVILWTLVFLCRYRRTPPLCVVRQRSRLATTMRADFQICCLSQNDSACSTAYIYIYTYMYICIDCCIVSQACVRDGWTARALGGRCVQGQVRALGRADQGRRRGEQSRAGTSQVRAGQGKTG